MNKRKVKNGEQMKTRLFKINSKEVTYSNGSKGRSYYTKVKLPIAKVESPQNKEDYLLDESGNKKLFDIYVGVKFCKGTKKVLDEMQQKINPNFKEFRFGEVIVSEGYLPFYVYENHRINETKPNGEVVKNAYPKLLVCEVKGIKVSSKETESPEDNTLLED